MRWNRKTKRKLRNAKTLTEYMEIILKRYFRNAQKPGNQDEIANDYWGIKSNVPFDNNIYGK